MVRILSNPRYGIPVLLFVVSIMIQLSGEESMAACAEPSPPLQALDESDVVFLGQVVDSRELTSEMREVVFNVSSAWKGVTTETVAVESFIGGYEYKFKRGTDYLIYAGKANGRIKTSICNRILYGGGAQSDIEVLGPGTTPTQDAVLEIPTQVIYIEGKPVSEASKSARSVWLILSVVIGVIGVSGWLFLRVRGRT